MKMNLLTSSKLKDKRSQRGGISYDGITIEKRGSFGEADVSTCRRITVCKTLHRESTFCRGPFQDEINVRPSDVRCCAVTSYNISIVVREQSMRPDLIEAMMYTILGEESKVSLHDVLNKRNTVYLYSS